MRQALSTYLPRLARTISGTGLTRLPGIKRLAPKSFLVEADGFSVYVDPRDQGISRDLIFGAGYEPEETRLLEKVLRPGMTFVDIGANIGYFTLVGARAVGSTGRVIAFEPTPSAFRLLTKNIAANGFAQVAAFPNAVTNRNASATLFLDARSPVHSSVSEANIGESAGSVTVETVSLDTFLPSIEIDRVDVVKIDAQGAELQILEGGEQTLAHPSVVVILEFWPPGLLGLGASPEELLRRVQALGFSIHILEDDLAPAGPEDVLRRYEQGDLDALNLVLQR